MSRELHIVLGDNWAEVRGWGSRDLITELAGRPPVYNTRTHSWCTTPARARDVAALAEIRSYDVIVTRAPAREPGALAAVPPPEHADPGPGLW